MAAAAIEHMPDNNLLAKDNRTGGRKGNPLEKFDIPDFQHAYTKHPINPLAAQYADEVRHFLESHGVDEQLGPKLWPALMRAEVINLMGYIFPNAEPRDFMWLCKFLGTLFAVEDWVDEGEYSNDPEKSLNIFLGISLALLWNNPDDTRLLEHVKELHENCITTDASRALLKEFHEDLVHARNKTKDRETCCPSLPCMSGSEVDRIEAEFPNAGRCMHAQALLSRLLLMGLYSCNWKGPYVLDIEMSPMPSAFRELWLEYCEAVPAECVLRLAVSLQEYMRGCAWEGKNRKAAYQIRTFEYYRAMRRWTSAVSPCVIPTDMLNATSQVLHIPNSLFYVPEMQSLLLAVTDVVGWHNDLFSFHKEVILAGDSHNLVKVLFEERNCSSYNEAGEIVLQLIHERIADMERAYEQVKAVASSEYYPAVDRYMTTCRDWVSGTHQWHVVTSRYRTAGTSR